MILTLVSCTETTYEFNQIQASELKEVLKNEVNIQLLDVRTAEEFNQGAIQGAKNIDFYNKDFTKKVTTTFNKEQPIYIYCKSGGRSTKASMKLIGEKFKTIYNLTGGYDGFKK